MTDTATTPSGRFILGAGGGRGIIMADTVDMPKPVRAANSAARDAAAQADQANFEYRAAREEARGAAAIDQARDREAIAAGQPLPEERAEVAAQAALTAAARRSEAAKGIADDAVITLARAITAAKPEWEPEMLERVEQIRAEALGLLDQLDQTLVRLAGAEAVAAGLAEWHGQGSLVVATFSAAQRLPDQTSGLREVIAAKPGQNRLIRTGITLT